MALGERFELSLAAAQAGREWGFEALYDEHNVRLVRYLAARAPGEGEDLAAEVWAAVAARLTRFEGGEREFRSWLFTIAHHRLVDHWDEQRRRPAVSGTDPYRNLAGGDEPEHLVVEVAAAQEAARRIAMLLSPDQAEVILLRLLGGLEVEDVARIVQKRPGTVRVLQHRGLKKLAAEFFLEGVTP